MSIAHPLRNAEEWGRVVVGGSTLPGILVAAEFPPRVWEWAIQNGYGQTKVTIYKSINLLDAIKFRLFLRLKQSGDDDWTALQAFLRVLIPGWPNKITGKPKAMPVVHPAAQYLGAQKVHLSHLYPPTPPPGETIAQYYEITVQEDAKQAAIKTGVAEPVIINGAPTPKTSADAALLNLLEALKAK